MDGYADGAFQTNSTMMTQYVALDPSPTLSFAETARLADFCFSGQGLALTPWAYSQIGEEV